MEPYAGYQPQTNCAPKAKPGTQALGRWVVRTYGGGYGRISASCTGRSVSEHKEGRAFDWTLNAARAADRARATRFLNRIFATGPSGEPAELARRMGVMYVIWSDRIYASYDQFRARALPELELQEAGDLLEDPAAPRPHAHLADPWRRPRPHQLVRRPGAGADPLGPG